MNGICALCKKETELQLSHIIPKFVGKYLKETSIGNIRGQDSPDKILQDIEKHYLLCHDCEELFSASERYFANTIFYPYLRDKKEEFCYTEQLFYFLTSLSWRSLYLDIADFQKDTSFKKVALNKMIASEQIMRDFLLGNRSDIGSIENHIFFFDRVESTSDPSYKMNPNVAIHRSLQSYSGYSDNTFYTISNLMGIVIVTLYSKDDNEVWNGTQILNGSSSIRTPRQEVQSRLGAEFQYWMEQKEIAYAQMSDKTKEKIQKKLTDIGEQIKDYPIYQDFLDDRNLKK